MLLSSLQRLAACGRPALGLVPSTSAIAAAGAAAATSSNSSLLWRRGYSDEAGGSDKPAEQPAAAAGGEEAPAAAAAVAEAGDAAAAVAAAGEEAQQPPVHPALIDPVDGSVLSPDMFSKRQLAWMGAAEDQDTRYKHFLPRLSRKEKGSFGDEYAAEEFDAEMDLYPTVPEDEPLYDLRRVVPEIYQPRSELFERVRRLKEGQYPHMPVEQFVQEVLGKKEEEEQPPRPGARKIIRWQICHVLSVGVREGHPANRKVKAWVYLRDLQEQYGMTDAALQHIAAICGPRYNPHKGELKLTSDKHPHREANRAHILQILHDLVAEGHRKHPAPPAATAHQQQQQQRAAAA